MSDNILQVVKSKFSKAFASKHPVKKGLSGFDDFAYLYFLTCEEQPEWILKHVLEPINTLRESLADCDACPWRLAAFAMRFSENKLPNQVKKYRALIEGSRNKIGEIRLQEVNAHIDYFREDFSENAWKYDIKLTAAMLKYGLPQSKQNIKEETLGQDNSQIDEEEEPYLFPLDKPIE